jgi:hypothetical protein
MDGQVLKVSHNHGLRRDLRNDNRRPGGKTRFGYQDFEIKRIFVFLLRGLRPMW